MTSFERLIIIKTDSIPLSLIAKVTYAQISRKVPGSLCHIFQYYQLRTGLINERIKAFKTFFFKVLVYLSSIRTVKIRIQFNQNNTTNQFYMKIFLIFFFIPLSNVGIWAKLNVKPHIMQIYIKQFYLPPIPTLLQRNQVYIEFLVLFIENGINLFRIKTTRMEIIKVFDETKKIKWKYDKISV